MWIEVFKAGEQTDSSGATKLWTEEELQNIVALYNEQPEDTKHEAPIVIGHPLDNSPAYGWVESLKINGLKLLAKLKKIDKNFKEIVNQGRYNKVSVAFYPDFLLRHIGFLGAVPPAVKGLKPVEFGEVDEYSEYEYEQDEKTFSLNEIEEKEDLRRETPSKYKDYEENEFADYINKRFPLRHYHETLNSLAVFKRKSIQQFYSEKERYIIAARLLQAARRFNINLTPKVWAFTEIPIPIDELSKQQLMNALMRNNENKSNIPITKKEFASMNEEMWVELLEWMGETFNEEIANQTAAKLEELKAKYETPAPTEEQPEVPEVPAAPEMTEQEQKMYAEKVALQKRIEDLEKKDRRNEHNQFTEQLISEGKLLPAQKNLIMPLLEGTVIGTQEFSENGKKHNTHDLLRKLAQSYPVIVSTQEFAEKSKAQDKQLVDFKLPDNVNVDEQALDIHNRALKFQEDMKAKGTTYSYQEAVKKVI